MKLQYIIQYTEADTYGVHSYCRLIRHTMCSPKHADGSTCTAKSALVTVENCCCTHFFFYSCRDYCRAVLVVDIRWDLTCPALHTVLVSFPCTTQSRSEEIRNKLLPCSISFPHFHFLFLLFCFSFLISSFLLLVVPRSEKRKVVSCPYPLACAKRVWCSEQHFLSHGAGPILDLRSPIRLQKT